MFRRRAIEHCHESSGFASVFTQRVRLRARRGPLKQRDSGVATRSHISTRPRRLSRPRAETRTRTSKVVGDFFHRHREFYQSGDRFDLWLLSPAL
ncbi:unnamed protein product [Pieris brassicae]|uniref:Uncharacterized protein n=1 Tax=Pieris brassicae TaxID=7116 RepID=A0A9P0TGR2_PIEBR|nr:unnamed protein product [Pieris brassicae]